MSCQRWITWGCPLGCRPFRFIQLRQTILLLHNRCFLLELTKAFSEKYPAILFSPHGSVKHTRFQVFYSRCFASVFEYKLSWYISLTVVPLRITTPPVSDMFLTTIKVNLKHNCFRNPSYLKLLRVQSRFRTSSVLRIGKKTTNKFFRFSVLEKVFNFLLSNIRATFLETYLNVKVISWNSLDICLKIIKRTSLLGCSWLEAGGSDRARRIVVKK